MKIFSDVTARSTAALCAACVLLGAIAAGEMTISILLGLRLSSIIAWGIQVIGWGFAVAYWGSICRFLSRYEGLKGQADTAEDDHS